MAPTLDWIEGFEHYADSAVAPSGTAVYAVLNRAAGTSYPAGRLGGVCVQLDADTATATYVRQDWPSSTLRVFAGWFKIAANPTVDNSTILIVGSSTTAIVAQFRVRTVANGGFITGRATTGVAGNAGPNVCDGAWHLLEFRLDTSSGTASLEWRVDGAAQTTSTNTLTSAATDRISFGSQAAPDDITTQWDDCIGSVTTADYTNRTYWTSPVATVGNGWRVAMSYPSGEGTDDTGTNNVVNQAGSQGGGTTLYQAVDDWATGAADGNTTYLTYQSTTLGDAASNWAEVTMDDKPAGIADIWKAVGNSGVISASTTASSMIVRVRDVDGSADLGDVTPGDISETTTRYNRLVLTTPASGWLSAFNNLRIRIGISPDTNPLPRITAVGIQYVYPVDATSTPSKVSGVAALTTPAVVADGKATPSTVTGITAVATPTAQSNQTVTPTVVAAVAAVPTPAIEATTGAQDAVATPGVVAAVAAVPTPATVAGAVAGATVVAAVAAVATPTVTAGASATPSKISGVAALTTPSVIAHATATPAVIAAVAAVPTPTATAAAVATPTVIAGVGAVPTPTLVVSGSANATPSVVAGIASVPTPTAFIVQSASATPAKVSAQAAVATPTTTAAAVVTATVVAGIAAVPTPGVSVVTSATATPAKISGLAAVATPTMQITSVPTPAKVSAITAVPTPAAHANANANPSVIEAVGIAYDAVATSDHSAEATPAVIEAVAEVTTPVVIGDANAEPDVIAAVTFIGAHAVVDNSWRGSAGDEWEQEDATGWEASGASEWSQTG